MSDFAKLPAMQKRQLVLDFLNAHPNAGYKDICAATTMNNKHFGLSAMLALMRRRGEIDRVLVHGAKVASWFAKVVTTANAFDEEYARRRTENRDRRAAEQATEARLLADGKLTTTGKVRVVRLLDKPPYRNQGGQGALRARVAIECGLNERSLNL